MEELYVSGPLVYKLVGASSGSLTAGTPYYVRASAINQIGVGETTTSPTPIAPASKPGSPSNVAISTIYKSETPIEEITVTWEQSTSNNGASIDGYLVEWWSAEPVPEVQKIYLTWETTPASSTATTFQLKLSTNPDLVQTTSALPYDISPENLRNALMSIGYGGGSGANNTYVIGDIDVTRTDINGGMGYEWAITFLDTAIDEINSGTVPLLQAELITINAATTEIELIRYQSGARPHGTPEVQMIMLSGNADVDGHFRLAFDGSTFSPYLVANCSADDMQSALGQLSTVRDIEVSREEWWNGLRWYITFHESVGDLSVLYEDTQYLTNGSSTATFTIYDGDYGYDETTGLMYADTVMGEKAAQYGSAFVSASTLAYTIDGLIPGDEYYVTVSASNQFGYGPRASSSPSSLTPPKQEPQPPTNATLEVNYGYSNSLLVKYDEPESDGGDAILRYRVELSTTEDFESIVRTDYYCPNDNKRTVWKIETSTDGGVINGGSFVLTLSANGYDYETAEIPYDAVAMATDETGFNETFAWSLSVTDGSKDTTASIDVSQILFPGDTVYVGGSKYAHETYTVDGIYASGTSVVFTEAFDGSTDTSAWVKRTYGGRGSSTTSKLYCEADSTYCLPERVAGSGSMQNKLEYLEELVPSGVNVIRTGPNDDNGFTWRVTFLDDSPTDPLDFDLSVYSNTLNATDDSANITITLDLEVNGEAYDSCSGTKVVPEAGGLIQGMDYYARIFAFNSIGYSLPQSALAPQKPMVVPSAPSSVTLERVSSTELQVIFNQPVDNGGDYITEYIVEWDTSPDFSTNMTSAKVTYLAGGAPFFKTISGLTTGTYYYVRVAAYNSQGYGAYQTSTPAALNPATKPSVPSNVFVGVTSDTLLTVSFSDPVNDGGDSITNYLVEWDVSSSFNSISTLPNKGSVTISASSDSAYTIQLLSANTKYYVRVSAINSVGYGISQAATPNYAYPSKQVPGKPHTILASTGSSVGEIDIAWQRPRVPHHAIQCSGTLTSPADCPVAFGDTLPASDGGSPIVEYEIEYNERSDFMGSDGGIETSTSSPYIITGLTPGRSYYVRILARNNVGSGSYCASDGALCTGTILSASAAE